jgi:hypothetical protein
MKFETHIRIRVSKILNDKLEKALSKSENKSDFIRSAIIEKIERTNSNEKNRNHK